MKFDWLDIGPCNISHLTSLYKMSIFVVHPFQGHLLHKFVLKTFNIYRIFLCFTAFYNVSVLAIFNITEAYDTPCFKVPIP